MKVKSNNLPELKICMLFSLGYEPDILVYPSMEILSYITHFGHRVTWIVSSEKDQPRQPFSRDGVKVYTAHYHHYSPGDGILSRIFNKIPHVLRRMRLILSIFREGKYDLILVRDDVFSGLIATYLKRRYKIPFVFELTDPLEQEWEMCQIKQFRPLFWYYLRSRFKKWLSLRLLHQADLVLPISKWLKDDLIKNKGISESKIMVLPEGANSKLFFHREREEEVVEKYQLNEAKVIIYEGTLDKARQLSLLLQAFSRVSRERQKARLLMVGDGDDRENLQNLAKELRMVDDVIFTGRVSQSEVPNFIAAAAIGVSAVPPLSFYKASSPVKMFEYMAMAKPVVANEEIPEHKEVLEESGGGILVPFAPEAFARAIIELLDNPAKAAEMGRRGREWVVKNRSYEVLARQVEEAYLGLVAGRQVTELKISLPNPAR